MVVVGAGYGFWGSKPESDSRLFKCTSQQILGYVTVMVLSLLLFWNACVCVFVCVCVCHPFNGAGHLSNELRKLVCCEKQEENECTCCQAQHCLIDVSIQPPLQASPSWDSGGSLIIDIGAHPYQWAQELAGLGEGVEEGQKKEQNVPVGSVKSGEALQTQKVLQLLLKQAKAVGKAGSAGLQKAA